MKILCNKSDGEMLIIFSYPDRAAYARVTVPIDETEFGPLLNNLHREFFGKRLEGEHAIMWMEKIVIDEPLGSWGH